MFCISSGHFSCSPSSVASIVAWDRTAILWHKKVDIKSHGSTEVSSTYLLFRWRPGWSVWFPTEQDCNTLIVFSVLTIINITDPNVHEQIKEDWAKLTVCIRQTDRGESSFKLSISAHPSLLAKQTLSRGHVIKNFAVYFNNEDMKMQSSVGKKMVTGTFSHNS